MRWRTAVQVLAAAPLLVLGASSVTLAADEASGKAGAARETTQEGTQKAQPAEENPCAAKKDAKEEKAEHQKDK